METAEFEGIPRFRSVSKLILCAISGALTGCFAIAGAFTGAIAGALAGRASESGLLRGASLGAIAGAILSVEVLEASRAYWCMEQTGSRGSSSMADFIEELVRGRLVEEPFMPAMLTTYSLQIQQAGIANISYNDIHDVHSLVASRGLSGDSLKKLPHHVISKEMKAENSICCTICLQGTGNATIESLPVKRESLLRFNDIKDAVASTIIPDSSSLFFFLVFDETLDG